MGTRASPLYVTTLDGEVPPRVLQSSRDTVADIEPQTILQLFNTAVAEHRDRPALAHKKVPQGSKSHEVPYEFMTYGQYSDKVMQFARALLHFGFRQHEAINILAYNAPEWFVAYMGAMAVGGVAAGIYTTNNAEACHYITLHSEARIVVVDSVEQLKKYQKATAAELPNLEVLVMFGESVPEGFRCAKPGVQVLSMEAFLALGEAVEQSLVDARMAAIQPGHCAALIYTSGTTGPPKAVMVSHDNVTWCNNISEVKFPDRRSTDCMVSYLPLSHVAAQLLDIILPMRCGGCIYFAQPDALKGSLINTLREVRPHFFFAVPRVWEKFYEKMMEVRKTTPGAVRILTDTLKVQMQTHVLSQQYGEDVLEPMGITVAAKLFQEVKARMGLDRARYTASGAAPLQPEIAEYFSSLGFRIYEAFGQSESTGCGMANCDGAWKNGTVGRPYPGIECRVDPVTGELQYRGRFVFMGYLKMEKETREALMEGGWLRSGDVVTFDSDHDPEVAKPSGFMRITGRIKELIITAGGENVPPVLIENEILAALPGLASAMVVGDRRKYLTVLLTLYTDAEGRLDLQSKVVGESIGSQAKTPEEVAKDAKWLAYINAGVKRANAQATSRAQVVQRFSILPRDFSEEGGELTATLKLKRSVAAAKHADVIEAMYTEASESN